ncbi:E3 ubiquitin-protein ligase TRIP12-like [Dysidea avara]|uniref:E3 ubiquitin-protein ligase TRIP12-like n=1 Tax=Dysidea avara TaxID=196820 RepID=UPI003319D41E
MLEVYYEDEAGTGLDPTPEFFTLVSRELQHADLGIWHGDDCPLPTGNKGASSNTQFVHSPVGLFPSKRTIASVHCIGMLGPKTPSGVVDKVCAKFSFMGKFVARSLMDSRMHSTSGCWEWGHIYCTRFTAHGPSDGQVICTTRRSCSQETQFRKRLPTALVLGVENLTMEGGSTIEDLDLDFTLPAYPGIELKAITEPLYCCY